MPECNLPPCRSQHCQTKQCRHNTNKECCRSAPIDRPVCHCRHRPLEPMRLLRSHTRPAPPGGRGTSQHRERRCVSPKYSILRTRAKPPARALSYLLLVYLARPSRSGLFFRWVDFAQDKIRYIASTAPTRDTRSCPTPCLASKLGSYQGGMVSHTNTQMDYGVCCCATFLLGGTLQLRLKLDPPSVVVSSTSSSMYVKVLVVAAGQHQHGRHRFAVRSRGVVHTSHIT